MRNLVVSSSGVCLEAPLVFVSFLGKVAGKVAVWIGNWVTNKKERCCWFGWSGSFWLEGFGWRDEER